MVTTSLHASIVKLCKFLIKLYKYLFLNTHRIQIEAEHRIQIEVEHRIQIEVEHRIQIEVEHIISE